LTIQQQAISQHEIRGNLSKQEKRENKEHETELRSGLNNNSTIKDLQQQQMCGIDHLP
jgi:hypothetical protein